MTKYREEVNMADYKLSNLRHQIAVYWSILSNFFLKRRIKRIKQIQIKKTR